MTSRTRIVVELTPKEAEALWTAASNGRNDFLCDPLAAKIYFGKGRGMGNANRAITNGDEQQWLFQNGSSGYPALQAANRENVINTLFGGSQPDDVPYLPYRISLSNPLNYYSYGFTSFTSIKTPAPK